MGNFDQFKAHFKADDTSATASPDVYPGSGLISKRLSPSFSGKSYCRGLYRFHDFPKSTKWTDIARAVFPERKEDFFCFSYDWLGRQFAFDVKNEGVIYMIDLDQGDILSLESDVRHFHDVNLVQQADDILAKAAFEDFFGSGKSLTAYKSVGYKKPLFLGGDDNKDNQEVVDMEVYWELGAQLLDKIRPLESGTRVSKIKLA